jgi:hypothetical protein
MAKLQLNNNNQYTLTLPLILIKCLEWVKGDNIIFKLTNNNGELTLVNKGTKK